MTARLINATVAAPTGPAAPEPREADATQISPFEPVPFEVEATEIAPVEFEATPIGPQALVSGVAPITPRDRLAWRANAPMQPKKPQRPAGAPVLSACLAGSRRGLFDTNARNQMEMFG